MTTDPITASNAAQSEFYKTHDRTEAAGPDWDDLTPDEQYRQALNNGWDPSVESVHEFYNNTNGNNE